MEKFIFYFSFSLDNCDEQKTFGFLCSEVDFGKFVYFQGFIEDMYDQDVVDDIESDYGVHDWATSPVEGVNAIGFCTYEVKEEEIPSLMKSWQKAFKTIFPSCIVGKVHELTREESFNDGTVLIALEKKRLQ